MTAHPLLQKARELVDDSGYTLQELGVWMGYPEKSARQSAWQFLNSADPSLTMLKRFADAVEVDVRELL